MRARKSALRPRAGQDNLRQRHNSSANLNPNLPICLSRGKRKGDWTFLFVLKATVLADLHGILSKRPSMEQEERKSRP